jgi:hypothetical protein
MPWGGIVEHDFKWPPLPRLLPGLLDPVLTREYAILNEDSPCAFTKSKKGRRRNHRRAFARPYIPTIDYGFPKNYSAYLSQLSILFSDSDVNL